MDLIKIFKMNCIKLKQLIDKIAKKIIKMIKLQEQVDLTFLKNLIKLNSMTLSMNQKLKMSSFKIKGL